MQNGIEYGDMQLIAESATLLREGMGLAPEKVADTFSKWNDGDLSSFLIDRYRTLAAGIFEQDVALARRRLVAGSLLEPWQTTGW